MSGGLLQLVAMGAQDVYLTSQPSITFWKSVYRRHTNHAVESVQNTFNGTADWGKKVTANISRNGDLVSDMYLQVTLPAVTNGAYVSDVGLAMIKSVEVEIGGQRIDKNYGEFMKMWNEVTMPAEKKAGYELMTGGLDLATTVEEVQPTDYTNFTNAAGGTYYIPLQFWFCNGNPGSALPLIALQYHEVKVSFEFRPWNELVRATAADVTSGPAVPSIVDASIYVDYVFLDTEERRRFSQASHEYLITQCQFLGDESLTATENHKIRLNLNHPVKSIYWVITRDASAQQGYATGNQWFDFGDSDEAAAVADRVTSATLTLNGHDRFSTRPGSYFRLVQPYQAHTRVPYKNVYMYSFALNAESAQPSGSCNFSRIDNATLVLKIDAAGVLDNAPSKIKVFAINYNVLRILSGMAGLAYSN